MAKNKYIEKNNKKITDKPNTQILLRERVKSGTKACDLILRRNNRN